MNTVISVENLSKVYRLGQIGTGTFTNDLKVWWANKRGLPNPMRKIGQADPRNRDGDEIHALREINFKVKQGEVLGVIGRNGAGKSTLLKILSRVTAPTTGHVKVKGRIASLLEVGTGFHPELTGRENIFLNGAILGMTHKEVVRKFNEIVDFAEIEKFIDTPVKRYSSGMYVRLAFAVAAHLDPEILVVDEVLAVGDVDFQRKCLGKMGTVAREGRTVLFVSHNLSAIQSLCTSAMLLTSGIKVKESKNVKEVIEEYVHASEIEVNQIVDLSRHSNVVSSTNDIYIYRCALMGKDGKPTTKLQFGEPFSVVTEVKAQMKFKNISFVVGIDTKEEQRITTVKSDDYGRTYNASPGEYLKVSVSFNELVLYPGEYTVVLAIRSGKVSLDTQFKVIRFEVSELAYKKEKQFNGTWGLVKTNVTWNQFNQKL